MLAQSGLGLLLPILVRWGPVASLAFRWNWVSRRGINYARRMRSRSAFTYASELTPHAMFPAAFTSILGEVQAVPQIATEGGVK